MLNILAYLIASAVLAGLNWVLMTYAWGLELHSLPALLGVTLLTCLVPFIKK